MDAEGDIKELAAWWTGAQRHLENRGTPCFRGSLNGNAQTIFLDLVDAGEGFRVLVDVLSPGLCLWFVESSFNDEPIAYHLGLLDQAGTWHVLEVGTHVDDDGDEDLAEFDDDGSDLSQHRPRLDELVAMAINALVIETEVSAPHGWRMLRDLVLARVDQMLGEEPADVQRAARRFGLQLDLEGRRDLELALNSRHGTLIRSEAQQYARLILDGEPGLAAVSRAARRDAVYRYMKGIDPVCITRESSIAVADALDVLAVGRQDGLFGVTDRQASTSPRSGA